MQHAHLDTVDKRYALVRRAFDIKKDIELRYLEMGAVLKEIRDSGAWVDTYTSFDNPKHHNFLEDLGITKSTGNKLITIYDRLVVQHKVSADKLIEVGGWSKLAEILPEVTDDASARRYVDLAIAARNQRDLREMIREEKTGVSMMHCPHSNTYEITICNDCGVRFRVLDESEHRRDGADTIQESGDTKDVRGDDIGVGQGVTGSL